jgi:hypothetical protein
MQEKRKFLREIIEHSNYLTKQLRSGNLPEGEYFIQNRYGKTIYSDFISVSRQKQHSYNIVRVLLACPSYKEYVKMIYRAGIRDKEKCV